MKKKKKLKKKLVENIILSKEDFERFEKTLKNPPKPNEALIKAFQRLKRNK